MKITLDINKTDISIKKDKVIIDLNPETIGLNPEQLALLTCPKKVELSTLKPKDEFKLGDEVFIVLEQTGNSTKVISKEFAYNKVKFGNCLNWSLSSIREMLNNEYLEKIAAIIGEKNILPMNRDLTSLDGLDDFGSCTDKVSLLTSAEYAKYHKILSLKSNYPHWWWLITPISTPSNDYYRSICDVRSDGVLGWYSYDNTGSVRPVLNLDSSISVLLKN